jgi:hypothetical protein
MQRYNCLYDDATIQGGDALQLPLKEQGVPSKGLPPSNAPSQLEIRREVGWGPGPVLICFLGAIVLVKREA